MIYIYGYLITVYYIYGLCCTIVSYYLIYLNIFIEFCQWGIKSLGCFSPLDIVIISLPAK